jgi:succinate dehydrogenase/fumarate reductase flavoprotein subunit
MSSTNQSSTGGYDAVVIGSRGAGLVAACGAADRGARVVNCRIISHVLATVSGR